MQPGRPIHEQLPDPVCPVPGVSDDHASRLIPKHSFSFPASISILINWLGTGICTLEVCGMIDNLLLGNLRFQKTDFTPNIDYYKELAGSQHPSTLWIACSDSRLQSGHITQARAGELFIQRNIGNIVPIHDWNFATVLEYAVVHLKVNDVVICGHSNCGAIRALDQESNDAYIPLWLNNAREAKERVDKKISVPETVPEKEERYRLIEQENVRLQIEHLHSYPLLKKALAEKRVAVHGLYYDLATGALTRVT